MLCQNQLYISSGSTVTANHDITLSDADFNNNGTYNGAIKIKGISGGDTFINNNGTVNFTTLDIDGNNSVNIEISDINISSSITLSSNDANLTMGSANIILGSSAQINNETNESPILGMDGTYIKTTRDHTAGLTNDFGLIGVETSNGSTDMGSTEIFRRYGTFEIGGNPTVSRYYEINPTVNADLDLDVQFYLLDVDLNGLERSNLAAFRSTDNGVTFTNEGGTPATFYHAVDNVEAFSLWTFADASSLSIPTVGDLKDNVMIFPNPASFEVNILSNIDTIINDVELVTVSGQTIDVQLTDNNTFDVSNLSAGIYFLKIHSGNQQVTKKLIIKK